MNHCRTCKYWGLNADDIGRGVCLNTDVQIRVRSHEGLFTSQNFGCLKYQPGECIAEIFSREDQINKMREFILDRYNIPLP